MEFQAKGRKQRSTQVLIVIATVFSIGIAHPAHASDWGCLVMMCLANPNGAEAVTECMQPMEALREALRRNPPDPFPTCELADGSDSATTATTPLDASAYAIQSER